MVEVVGTPEFEDWFLALPDYEREQVTKAVDILADKGLALGFPHSSKLIGSRYGLRELRIQAKGHPIRVAYGFDPNRQAIVLCGGDKTGDDRFYEWFVPQADGLFARWLTMA